MKVDIHVINAFSINNKGGNPAGVVFDADELSNASKQAIAAKAGFPETAFVSKSSKADFKLDFFTPVKQIEHCGHATVATFSFLKSAGKIAGERSSKETVDGCRTIVFKDRLAFMEQTPPVITKFTDTSALLESLNITKNELMPALSPAIVNTGNAFLIIAVRDESVLAELEYDRDAVYRISEQYRLIGYYAYTHSGNADATARMFAPFYGIDEEAATGMAAGPLTVYLAQIEGRKQHAFKIEQGRYMSPASVSLIEVELATMGAHITGLFAGGAAHVSSRLSVEVA